MSKLWVSNGVSTGMFKNEFTSILSGQKIGFTIKDYKYFEAIIYHILDYEYYADYPMNDEDYGFVKEGKDKLTFIVVNKSTNIEYWPVVSYQTQAAYRFPWPYAEGRFPSKSK